MKKTKKTVWHLFFRFIRAIAFVLLAIFLVLNILIVLSGKTYLYRGIWLTYLSGYTGPTIYDLDKFPHRLVAKGKTTLPWKGSPAYDSPTHIDYFQKYNNDLKSTAFLIFENDSIVYEQYWDNHHRETLSNSFSIAKTVVALLIGIAIDEKKINGLDDPVSVYIPEFKREDLSEITIRHLLLMASGLNWTESGSNPLSDNAESYYGTDLYGLVTRQKRIDIPGKTFLYQGGNTQLLGFILQKATGYSVSEYCSLKLWSKMGMESDAYWSLDKEDGDEKAFCCLYATARDFGKIGKLINQAGKWNGEQLIPSWYFQEMIKVNQEMMTEESIHNYQYGFHIWSYQGYSSPVYYCRGILGQYIISIPEKKWVIVRLGQKRTPSIQAQRSDFEGEQIKRVGHTSDFLEYIQFAEKIVAARHK